MKKVFLAVLLGISVNSFAQLIQIGPQLSANITSVYSDNFATKNSGSDIGAGAFARVNLLLFYGQAEFGYAKSKFNVSYTGNEATQYELSGTDASLIAGFKIITLDKLGNIRIFAGYNWKNYSDIKTNNDLNPIDIAKNNQSILGGVGADLWRFTFDARYLGGLSNISNSSNSIKTGVVNLSLGFKFL